MNIAYNLEAQRKIMAGIDLLADSIKYTMGPKGRNVAMHQKANLRGADYSDRPRKDARVLITNDGATIARSLVLSDPFENLGVRLIKEAAIRTEKSAGDGTSTTVLLTQEMLHHVFQLLGAGGNSVVIRRGMKKAAEVAVQKLKEISIPVKCKEDIAKTAAISCQDAEIGRLIGKAFSEVGLEGVILVDESRRVETMLEIQKGIVFDRGYISAVMCTDEKEQIAELDDPYILLCDNTFTNAQDLIPYLIMAAEDGRSCLIISEGVKADALGLIVRNKIEGDMDIVCVNAPEYGEGRRWRMEDLALQTGGVFITKELGINIRNVTREMLGTARHVKVTRNQTVIEEPGGDPEQIEKRVQELRYLVKHTDYEFNQSRYKERLAKFVSGVAYIHVGGQTEPEMWERKMRTEDAVYAARAALEEGIIPGGGTAFIHIAQEVADYAETIDEEEERAGAMAVSRALKAPAQQIIDNAGLDGAVLAEKISNMENAMGFDVEKETYTDMIEAGILDAAKAARAALENAVSIAGTIITAEAGVADVKYEKGV